MLIRNIIISIFALGFAGNAFAYNDQVDSLEEVLSKLSDPEDRAYALMDLGNQYLLYSNDTAIAYFDRAYDLAHRSTNVNLKAEVSYKLGLAYQYIDIAKSAEYTIESLEYSEKSEDARLIGYSRTMLGNLYRANGELEKAMIEYKYALKVAETALDSLQIARCYNNIGIVHMMEGEYDTGLEYWLKSLDMKIELGEEEGAAATMSNIALYYKDIGRYFEAKQYLDRALEINIKNKDYESISFCYTIIGDMHWRMDAPSMAVEAYKMSLAYSDTINSYYDKADSYIGLSRVLDSLNRFEEALYYQRLYTELMVEFNSENNSRITRELTTQFETEKKEKENTVLKVENEAKDAKISLKEANNRYLLLGIGLIAAVLILIVVVLSRVRSAKREIEAQKHIVEEKNREITDSISYAKRLQDAILPTEETINQHILNNFVLYLPKDIVAGDFYWMEPTSDKVLFAVADCTGHGVPGALVSVVCHNALNRAVREFRLSKPGDILEKVTDLVIETFEKSTEEVKDGMDIGLCSFDFQNKELEFAGANNGLYKISNGELEEIKATKQPVGKYANRKPFENHLIKFTEGDVFYLFSDGYADQFGGEKGKKMKYRPFKELIIKHHNEDLTAQKKVMHDEFVNWMADYEQVDDVCVVGIKV